ALWRFPGNCIDKTVLNHLHKAEHDNTRPHTSLITRQKLRKLGWEVLMHPPYSPDIAPSDYHLFRSLQTSLNGKAGFKRGL
ncbi:SETMR methyltransferase, partial [Acromyrmex charruanus]